MSEVKREPAKSHQGSRSLLERIFAAISKFRKKMLTLFTNWIDPKLEPYRQKSNRKAYAPNLNSAKAATRPQISTQSLATKSTAVDTSSKPNVPQTIDEFLDLMKRTPRSVLSSRERQVIATIMNFPNIHVADIMLPQSAITYVRDNEVLGPLTLDRLYRSGYQHFPVVDEHHKIIGLIHTTALNSLEIKKTSRAEEILDRKVYYLRQDYTLNQALAAFLRTNCYFFLVIDRYEHIIGMITYQMIVDYILGETPVDDFDRDSDRLAVAKRK